MGDLLRISGRMAARGLAALLVLGLIGACARNPATGSSDFILISEEDEAQIGALAHDRIVEAYGGRYNDPAVDAYVSGIVQRLARTSDQPDLTYRSTVLDSPLVNAFALPGGYVYVTRGLLALANDESELAGVIAHEIGHVAARHVAQRQAAAAGTYIAGAVIGAVAGGSLINQALSLGSQGVLASYSRDQEYEADMLAVRYLARAGYDPEAVVDFLRTLEAQSRFYADLAHVEYDSARVDWLSSHPATEDRIIHAAEQARAPSSETMGRERAQGRYFEAIDGLLYGDSPEDGYVRGRTFIHVPDGIRFVVPEGFQLANTTNATWALGPDKSVVKLDAAQKSSDQPIDAYLVEGWAAAFRVTGVTRFTVDGMAAALGRTRLQGMNTLVVAIEYSPTRVFRFLAGTSPQSGSQYDAELLQMIRSFERLEPHEIADIHPLALRVTALSPSTSVQQAAALMALGDRAEDRFRVLNGIPAEQVEVGQGRVKLVTEAPPGR